VNKVKFIKSLRLKGLLSIATSLLLGCEEISKLISIGAEEILVASPDDPCTLITKGQALRGVTACDRGTYLELLTPEWKRRYPKKDLRWAVGTVYQQFQTNPDLGAHGLEGAAAEVWLDVALLNPEDVQFVLLFRVKTGFVMTRQPLDLKYWEAQSHRLIFIPEFEYPSRKLRKVGVLQIVPQPHVGLHHVEKILDESGIKQTQGRAGHLSGTWPNVFIKTRPFDETATVSAIASHPRARLVLSDILFVPVGEREGIKYKLMTLTLDPYSHHKKSESSTER
jgi:hypothetical protein